MNDISRPSQPSALSKDLLRRVTERLGIPQDHKTDLDGLRTVYRGWCSNIPFDNMRKMISLRSGDDSKLAGLDAEDFFENFLANGTGGTCWPSSNALYVLVRDLGFDARRAAGACPRRARGSGSRRATGSVGSTQAACVGSAATPDGAFPDRAGDASNLNEYPRNPP